MKHKVFTLSTCDTSKRILKEAQISNELFDIKDIKKQSITKEELDQMKSLAGSYESLFSRRAQKYKLLKLKDKNLTEDDYRQLILEEYTFLKRPVIIIDNEIFVGNSKKNIEELVSKIKKL